MAICMCNLFACLIILILLAMYLDTSDLTDVNRALLLATLPIPLVSVFYWLLAKALRKQARDQR